MLTPPPIHELRQFEGPAGAIVADVFRPRDAGSDVSRGALVLALGVPVKEADRAGVVSFGSSLARLGYVVLWPRSASIDQGRLDLEDPQTFVEAVRHLQHMEGVDADRISMFGFSIGGSLALVAAGDPTLAHQLRSITSLGAYFDIGDYLTSLKAHTATLDGRTFVWEPPPWAAGYLNELLASAQASPRLNHVASAMHATDFFESVDELALLEDLNAFSPSRRIQDVRATVFVLHERSDPFVPYVEAIKLRRALPEAQVGGFLLTDLFAHTSFKSALDWSTMSQLGSLFGFTRSVLSYL